MKPRDGVFESLLDTIPWTPMLQLARIGGVRCPPLAKCGFLSPWGSIDVHAAIRILRSAEAERRIKPGDTIVEPSTGETGVGLAMAAAAGGYRMIMTMPEGAGRDKQPVLDALGVTIIRTPAGVPDDAPDGYVGAARWIATRIPGAHLFGDRGGPLGLLAHEVQIANEILHQCATHPAAIVVASNAGGLGGVARVLKTALPQLHVVAVEVRDRVVGRHGLVGVGAPRHLHEARFGKVDAWVECGIGDANAVARRLARDEGLLVGPLSGAVVWAAMQLGCNASENRTTVTVLPDALDVDALDRCEGKLGRIRDIVRAVRKGPTVHVAASDRVGTAMSLFRRHEVTQLPVVDRTVLAGTVSKADVLRRLLRGSIRDTTPVRSVMRTAVSTVHVDASASEVFRILDRDELAVALDDDRHVVGVITRSNLAEMFARHSAPPRERAAAAER